MSKLFKYLLACQACIWIVFGITTYTNAPLSIILPLLMLLAALGFIFVLFTFEKHMIFKILGLAYIVLNLMLTFTDEFGVFDFFILTINILTILSMVNTLKGENNAESKE